MLLEDFMSIPQVAQHLQITRASVYRAMDRGMLPFVNIGGRRFVERANVERFVPRAYRQRPGSKPKGRPRKAAQLEAEVRGMHGLRGMEG